MKNNRKNFSRDEVAGKRKKTQREVFFAKMEKVIPLKELCRIIEPYYYERGNVPSVSIDVMLKMYLVSRWFNLSDDDCEDMLNESLSAREYVGIKEYAPAAAALRKFREVLESNGLTEKISALIDARLRASHIVICEGKISNAVITVDTDTDGE